MKKFILVSLALIFAIGCMAAGLGFNTVRVFLSDLVYTADPAGSKNRFNEFLNM